MEQMTAGMTSYFRSISKLQASTSAMPAPTPSELSSVGSAILDQMWEAEVRDKDRTSGAVISGPSEPVLVTLREEKVLMNYGQIKKERG